MDVTRLPVWLRPDGTEQGRLQATACSLDLSVSELPKATITIASTDEIPSTHDFVEIYTEHGSAGLFRVVSSTYRYGQTCQLQLIGAADTLSDDIWPETVDEATRTASEWIQLILAKQTTARWQLGTCALSASIKIKVNYNELWAMLEDIRSARPDYMWTYDYSTSPWTLSLVHMPDTVSSEFRVTRNVESAQITVSDQQMCNRLIFTVTDGNDGDPVVTTYNDTTSQTKYGIRTRCTDIKTDEIPTGMTAAEYAQQLLSEHAVPDYAIQINGADLSKLTGMDLDHFELGYLCRAVLPEYGEAVEERIVALSYPNVISEPHSVRVSLSTQLGDITGSIASAKKVAQAVQRARGGGGAKADKDSWAKVLTDVIEATDGTGIKQMWQSGVQMTSHGGLRLFSLYQGLSSLDSELTITNTEIRTEVNRATVEEGRLSSSISQNAEQIALRVQKGNVATQLAVECGNVTVSEGNLIVNGMVTAEAINAAIARADLVTTGTVTAGTVEATYGVDGPIITGDTLNVTTAMNFVGDSIDKQTITIDGVQQTAKFLGTAPLSFSIAGTAKYRAAVSAAGALTGAWSKLDPNDTYAPIYTVTSGTGEDREITVSAVSPNGWEGISSGNPGSCTVYADAAGGHRAKYTVDGTLPYQQGLADGGGGGGDVVVSGSWNGKTYTAVNNKNSSSASTTITIAQGAWTSDWKKTISVSADGNVIDSSTVINGQSVYDTGAREVTIDTWTYNSISGGIPTMRTMTANASNGATKDIQLNLVIGSWDYDALERPVYLRTDSTTGNTRAQVKVGGSQVWNKGGQTAHLSRTGSVALGYGESVTITAQYTTAAGNNSNVGSTCTITAPEESTISKNDITCGYDSAAWGVDSQPNADARTFAYSGQTITQLGKWYRMKITVKGVTKTYSFKTVAP